jgi:hypothetical protein
VLAGALWEYEGALRASLRAEYGIDLRDPGVNLLDLADLVENLPPGCALWRATGGPLAWSEEVHFLTALLHRLDVITWQNTGMMHAKPKGNAPDPVSPPPARGEVDAKAAVIENKRARREARRANR